MPPLVTDQTHLGTEHLTAVFALIALLIPVRFLVNKKFSIKQKPFSTVVTHEGLLFNVNAMVMGDKTIAMSKHFPTVVTFIGL